MGLQAKPVLAIARISVAVRKKIVGATKLSVSQFSKFEFPVILKNSMAILTDSSVGAVFCAPLHEQG